MAHNNANNVAMAQAIDISMDFERLSANIHKLNQYYVSRGLSSNIADEEDMGNGVTGAEFKAFMTSINAIDTWIDTQFHRTNLNAIK